MHPSRLVCFYLSQQIQLSFICTFKDEIVTSFDNFPALYLQIIYEWIFFNITSNVYLRTYSARENNVKQTHAGEHWCPENTQDMIMSVFWWPNSSMLSSFSNSAIDAYAAVAMISELDVL